MSAFHETFDLADGAVIAGAQNPNTNTAYTNVSGTQTQVADTDVKHVGTASLSASGAGNTTLLHSFDAAVTTHYRRCYYRAAAPPASAARIQVPRSAGNTANCFDVRLMTDGTVQLRNSSLAAQDQGAIVVTDGEWFRIEVGAENGAATVRLFVGANVDGDTPDEELTGTYATKSIDAWWSGSPGGGAFDFFLDDEVGSDAAWVGSAVEAEEPPPPAASPTVVGSFAATAVGGQDGVSTTYPTGIQAGDVGLMVCSTNALARTLSQYPGWAVVDGPRDTPSFKRSYLLQRQMVAADSGGAVSTTWSGAAHHVMAGLIVRGAAPTLDAVSFLDESADPTNFLVPAFTATVDDCLGACLASGGGPSAPVLTHSANWADDRNVATNVTPFVSAHVLHQQFAGGAGADHGGDIGTLANATSLHAWAVSLAPAASVAAEEGMEELIYDQPSATWVATEELLV